MLTEFFVRLAISALLLAYFSYSGLFKQVSVRRFVLMTIVFCVLYYCSMLLLIDFFLNVDKKYLSFVGTLSPSSDFLALLWASIISWLALRTKQLKFKHTMLTSLFLFVASHVFILIIFAFYALIGFGL